MYEHLNDIYITDRLEALLPEIEAHTVTTVIAPMGYGKTTAIRHWQARMSQFHPDAIILRQSVLGDSVGELWRRFCRLLARHDAILAARMREAGFPRDIQGCGLVADLWEEHRTPPSVWWILDDVHLLPQGVLSPLVLSLPDGLEGFHMVMLSRNRIITRPEQLKLGRHLCEIRMNDLALTEAEVRRYAAICGLSLNDVDAARMMKLSEGWISLIYLFLRSMAQGGKWGFDAPDVFILIDKVMLEPLPERERDFLLCCSVAEEFTREQAAFLWQGEDAGALLTALSENNAFITVNEEGLYRCHNILLQSVRRRFGERPENERRANHARLGDWHFRQGEYLDAMHTYRRADAWEELLKALVADRGNSLDGEQRDAILDWCGNCPEELLRSHPEALLVLTLGCFTVGAIPEMLRMNDLMLDATQGNPELSKEERDNYLGESQVLLSFLQFNSITGMSEYQRRAGGLMSRPTQCLDLKSPWTFGAPSILSLYHRDNGALDDENAEMKDCMPWYEKISEGHGSGAEHVFEAEVCFFRGDWDGAKIAWHRAVEKAEEKEQHSILAAAAFLAVRMDLMEGDFARLQERLRDLREGLKRAGQLFLLITADMCEAWCYAMLGRPDYAPAWVADSPAVSMKGPAWPSFLTIRDQTLLARGEFQRLIASGEGRTELFAETHALLPSIYLHVQLAGANLAIGRREDARRELQTALDLAEPDRLWLPFAENGPHIRALLAELPKKPFTPLLAMTDRFLEARDAILKEYFPSTWDADFTDREREVAKLAIQRLSGREIAEKLHLSENTVKTHLRHVYEKLGISGTNRNKRAALEQIAG
ncbi:MAG: hypothetical protein IJU98_12565 [Synergistaceae bacterium]|nr:hypothetical protein [Synergistaceae bacterium]